MENNIQKLRVWKGMSQQTLAEKARVSISSIRYWEANTRQPKMQSLLAIARALEVDIEKLYNN